MAQDTQVEGKKLEIVKQAFDRFYEGGFHATGVDTVMADSGISKRTLYKYFPSKEELIEAVLDYYGAGIVNELFDPVMAASDDPRERILAFFDIRKAMIDESPTRGCLGVKASREYVGKHEGIAALGKSAPLRVEQRFIEMCQQAGFCGAFEPRQTAQRSVSRCLAALSGVRGQFAVRLGKRCCCRASG